MEFRDGFLALRTASARTLKPSNRMSQGVGLLVPWHGTFRGNGLTLMRHCFRVNRSLQFDDWRLLTNGRRLRIGKPRLLLTLICLTKINSRSIRNVPAICLSDVLLLLSSDDDFLSVVNIDAILEGRIWRETLAAEVVVIAVVYIGIEAVNACIVRLPRYLQRKFQPDVAIGSVDLALGIPFGYKTSPACEVEGTRLTLY